MTTGPDISLPTGNATVCISVAARPSRFGITVHNAGYRHLGLDFFYKAIRAEAIGPVIEAVRTLDFRGCSVSMPFKLEVIPLLDSIDPTAAAVGAVNTVVNDHGRLTGFNTDVTGARRALETLGNGPLGRVLVMGGGGAARAVLAALIDLGASDIKVALRDPARGAALGDSFDVEIVPWGDSPLPAADLLVNASPVGMAPGVDDMPVPETYFDGVRAIMDVVATPAETKLLRIARERGIMAADGITMTLHQAAEQFELYTGERAPIDVMRAAFERLD